MRTVPGYIATLLVTQPVLQASISQALADSGRLVGARTELDLDHLASLLGEEVAGVVLGYHTKCIEFQEYLGARQSGYKNENRPAIQISRPLMKAVQVDRKEGRKDLKQEMDALLEVPILGQYVSALLDSTSSVKRPATLQKLSAALGAVVEDLGDNKTRVTLSLPSADHPWGVELGGAATPGEVSRVFILTVSHAAWRDRRVRRLLSVEVSVEELWAHPLTAAASIARLLPASLLTKATAGHSEEGADGSKVA